ncbi:MAG: DNRLRE domain-containing protein [Methanosarcinales archaeon]|nr:DNRLRE domain-containing protein [Methanosarcinales archaeon]
MDVDSVLKTKKCIAIDTNKLIFVIGIRSKGRLNSYDLSSIPTSATIESATISLHLNTTVNTKKVSFHRVLQDWNEDDVTWNNWYLSLWQNGYNSFKMPINT